MISPRTTRLVRVDGLHAFRDALVTLATAGARAAIEAAGGQVAE